VECYVKVRYSNNKRRVEGINGFQNSIAGVPFSTGTSQQPAYSDRGTAGLLLLAASYYDPSILNVKLGVDRNVTGSLPVPTGTDAVQMTPGKLPGTVGVEGE
jgi:hypothetical protein